MRVAAIDVGTNSTRLLVAESVGDGFRPIDRRMTITRLGQGVDATRTLDPRALERTLVTIADYVATCGELQVSELRVTATSAVRDALNKEAFFGGVRTLTGDDPQLLSGDEEAIATFLGVHSDLESELPALVVDIGGGSTELIAGKGQPSGLISLDIGCVRMFEKYLHSDPPSTEEVDQMRAEILSELGTARAQLDVHRDGRLVGVAGTVTQLATLKMGLPVYDPDVTHHLVMTHGDVRLLAKRLFSLSFEQRKRITALDPGRADVILAGAQILLDVMEVFDKAEVLVSEKDILDGLVLQMLV